MIRVDQGKSTLRPAGYAALIERYGLDVIPNWHISRVTTSGAHRIDFQTGVTEEVYPRNTGQGTSWAIILNSNSNTTARISRFSPAYSKRQLRTTW